MGFAVPGSDVKSGVVAIAASTNFPAGTAPQVLSGASIVMNKVAPGTLSALVTVLPQTNTLTMYAKWQVCDNGTDWYDCVPSNNAANVIIATGTSGTDTATTVSIAENPGVYGHKLARIQLYSGVASTTTGDLGSAKYYYRENVRF